MSGEMEDCLVGAQSDGTSIDTILTEEDDNSQLDSSLTTPSVCRDSCENCLRRENRDKQRRVMKRLGFAAVLYFLFMVGEIVGGYIANSLAIMTDALHMLTDLVGIIVSLLALWLSEKPPTKRFTFGYHRSEVVAAGISVLLIYILTGVLVNEAVKRTVSQDFSIDGDVMLITAAVGVTVNLIMGLILGQMGHLHSHSHGPPQPTQTQSSAHGHGKGQGQVQGHGHGNLAVRAAFVHAMGDMVQSIGVLIAAYVIRFKPEYKLADPICTYVFSILVLFTTVRIVRDTLMILLEGAPKHVDVAAIQEDLLSLEEVQAVEELNIWALTADKTMAMAHLQLVPSRRGSWEKVQAKVRDVLLHSHRISHCTIQIQHSRPQAPSTCTNCEPLSV